MATEDHHRDTEPQRSTEEAKALGRHSSLFRSCLNKDSVVLCAPLCLCGSVVIR